MKNAHEYRLWLYGLLALVIIAGPLGYFSYVKVQENRAAEIQMLNKSKDVELELEKERTDRSKSRWDAFGRMIPWYDKEKDE